MSLIFKKELISMARTKREQSPIGAYHVLLRSSETLFLSDADRAVFEDLCRRYFSGKALYSLAMLPDRVHMVFSDGGEGVSATIKPLTTSYARYYNRTYKREGKLFSDRFKSTAAADNAQLADCVIYVDSTYGASPVCDKESFFANICSKEEYAKRINTRLGRVCLDAYDAFSDEDILTLMCRISGSDPADVSGMTDRQKRELVRAASEHRWVSVRRMSEALGLEKPVSVQKKPASAKGEEEKRSAKSEKTEKTEKKTQTPPVKEENQEKDDRRNLSVWLL